MNPESVLRHTADTALLSLLFFGGVVVAALVMRGTVPDEALPGAAIAAMIVQAWRADAVRLPDAMPLARLLGFVILTAALATVIAWGSLATGSRFWDGAAMWDLKTRWFVANASLEQPSFRDPAVYCHSRDYPPLQPMLVAILERLTGHGRLLFPALYVLQWGLLFVAVRRLGGSGALAGTLALAYCVTPMVMSPTSGGFDSGYADAFLAVAVTATVGGLTLRDRLWTTAGIAIAVWVKPEGSLYGVLAIVLAWLGRDRAQLRVAVAAWTIALMAWSVVQRDLQSFGRAGLPWALLGGVLAFAITVLSTDRVLVSTRARVVACLAAVVAGAVLLPAAITAFGLDAGTWGAYLSKPQRALARLADLPAILNGLLANAVLRGQFGLAFVVALLAAFVRGSRPIHPLPSRWLVAMVLVLPLPFLLTPIDDLEHHLRSTMPRLLFHHLGVAILATAAALTGGMPCSGDAGELRPRGSS